MANESNEEEERYNKPENPFQVSEPISASYELHLPVEPFLVPCKSI